MNKTSPITALSRPPMNRKKIGAFASVFLLVSGLSMVHARLEREQMALDSQIQQRIENILSKTLPPTSYLITVKVEMDTNARPTTVRKGGTTGGRRNPFESQSQYVLPGVPQRKDFVLEETKGDPETVTNSFEVETLVRRILITVLV